MVCLRLTLILAAACFASAQEGAWPSPKEVEKFVCEVASQKQIEDKATAEICALIAQKANVPDCQGKVEKLWDKTTALCQMPLPSPEQIEKLVCEVATQKQIEEKATAEICNLISDKVAIPDCQGTLQKLWDEATAICQMPGPIPEQIERLVCEVATKKEFKEKVDQAAAEICTLIAQQGVTIPDCQGEIEKLWDTIVAQCPKGHEMSSPSPDEIRKLLCEVATKKEFKQKVDEAAAQICTMLAKHGATVPDCQNVLEEMWDKLIVAECPKGRAMTFPSPDEIEKMVCEVATQKQIEDKASAEICALISKKVTVPDCQASVEMLWDTIKAKCPKGRAMTFPSPDEIEKMVCEVATQKQIEDKASAEICALISKKVTVPDCQASVEMLWDKIKAKCPKGRAVTFPSPDEIERLVCKVATKKQIEDEAAAEICTLISKKVTIPDCQGAVELLWDKIKAKCPKGREQAVIVV